MQFKGVAESQISPTRYGSKAWKSNPMMLVVAYCHEFPFFKVRAGVAYNGENWYRSSQENKKRVNTTSLLHVQEQLRANSPFRPVAIEQLLHPTTDNARFFSGLHL